MRQFLALPVLALLCGCASMSMPMPTQRVAGEQGDFSSAVAAPLYDINVLKTKIPPVLIAARDTPYRLPAQVTCGQIALLITDLDEVLGPDLDVPASETNPSLLERSGSLAQGAVESAAESLIPLRGWVRLLTGAETHDRLVRESIVAGGIRRSFLKGLGQARGCSSPSAPSRDALAGVVVDPIPERRGPQFPIR